MQSYYNRLSWTGMGEVTLQNFRTTKLCSRLLHVTQGNIQSKLWIAQSPRAVPRLRPWESPALVPGPGRRDLAAQRRTRTSATTGPLAQARWKAMRSTPSHRKMAGRNMPTTAVLARPSMYFSEKRSYSRFYVAAWKICLPSVPRLSGYSPALPSQVSDTCQCFPSFV